MRKVRVVGAGYDQVWEFLKRASAIWQRSGAAHRTKMAGLGLTEVEAAYVGKLSSRG